MPSIIDYPDVLQAARGVGLRCVYYNSGAFELTPAALSVRDETARIDAERPAGPGNESDPVGVRAASPPVQIVGWLGPDDPTIRPGLPAVLWRFAPPFEPNLAAAACRFWQTQVSAQAWLLPASHWAYELDFGSADWMAEMLRGIGIDPEALRHRTNAAAIAFDLQEIDSLGASLTTLLLRLTASDFTLLCPDRRLIVTLHHHKQLWWQTDDPSLASVLTHFPAGADALGAQAVDDS